ncbi:hypothetical protein F442_14406 [Phytophthora nicotianae P10297]|nr:hypothetical protein F442_14406 [Phytophthora nicotianae P10297]
MEKIVGRYRQLNTTHTTGWYQQIEELRRVSGSPVHDFATANSSKPNERLDEEHVKHRIGPVNLRLECRHPYF